MTADALYRLSSDSIPDMTLPPSVVPELSAAIGPEPSTALLSCSPSDPTVRERLRACLQALMTREPAEVSQLLDSLVDRLAKAG